MTKGWLFRRLCELLKLVALYIPHKDTGGHPLLVNSGNPPMSSNDAHIPPFLLLEAAMPVPPAEINRVGKRLARTAWEKVFLDNDARDGFGHVVAHHHSHRPTGVPLPLHPLVQTRVYEVADGAWAPQQASTAR